MQHILACIGIETISGLVNEAIFYRIYTRASSRRIGNESGAAHNSEISKIPNRDDNEEVTRQYPYT